MQANLMSARNTTMTFLLRIVAIPRATSCASFMLMTCHRFLRVEAFLLSRYLNKLGCGRATGIPLTLNLLLLMASASKLAKKPFTMHGAIQFHAVGILLIRKGTETSARATFRYF